MKNFIFIVSLIVALYAVIGFYSSDNNIVYDDVTSVVAIEHTTVVYLSNITNSDDYDNIYINSNQDEPCYCVIINYGNNYIRRKVKDERIYT